MAKKLQQKDEKDKKKKSKDDRQHSSLWMAMAMAVAALVVAMPQLMETAKKARIQRPQPPVNDIQLSFPAPPDARPSSCPKDLTLDSKATETVSIIIPYLNEEWFRIEATMQSLIKYTDMRFVREIMWISDGNSPDKVFASEIRQMHSKVSVHENPKNLGLIFTKMEAVKRARGDVLMFLEPHVVVTSGWLEPLLKRLIEEPKALLMPTLDALGEDLSYHEAGIGHWRFEWNLNLVYSNPSGVKTRDQPYMSPGTSGGIYAIRKDWWDELELFDPELVRWGGDHVEASHKVWRCGGRIEVHPCSRVGHWFREVEQRPYPLMLECFVKNYKRLVEVWFDKYKNHFYKMKPEARDMEIGSVDDMKARRTQLKCKDMAWYIKNVDVELGWEANKICIAGLAAKEGGCGVSTKPAYRRSTILEVINAKEYKRLTASADAFRLAEPCCRALGRGCKRICGPGESPRS
jgi:glycosyltransferase involved in cell wall biosynthesis